MADWTQSLQEAIDYIEQHLTEELDIREISARAYLSPYYFQRVFHALCGVSVAEYVRQPADPAAGGRDRGEIRPGAGPDGPGGRG